MHIKLGKYFERIGYEGPTDPTVEVLRGIARAQKFSIPFENFEVHRLENENNLNDYISLNEDDLFNKLVFKKRGGICHENNELLAIVLTHLGFKVNRLWSQTLCVPGLSRSHKLLMVTIEGQPWIVDVGITHYGLFEPIPLIENIEVEQCGHRFKVIKNPDDGRYGIQIFDFNKHDWKNTYEFTLDSQEPKDFKQMHYGITHLPNGFGSFLVNNRVCYMPKEDGTGMTLVNHTLKFNQWGEEESISITDEEYSMMLEEHFKITLPKDFQFKPLAPQITPSLENKEIDLEQYFKRIGYSGSREISIENLIDIAKAQISTVPFENLTIHESENKNSPKNYISLATSDLFKKLVLDKKGGVCHENNELLALVLTQLGFKVDRLWAQVLTFPGLPRGHKLLMVSIQNQRWIVDVGFPGHGLFEPIQLSETESVQFGTRFRFTKDEESGKFTLMTLAEQNEWKSIYDFTLTPYQPKDFIHMNYGQTHMLDAFLVKNKVCAIAQPDGTRVTLCNHTLKIKSPFEEEEVITVPEEKYTEVLKTYFGIEYYFSEKNIRLELDHPRQPGLTSTRVWCTHFKPETFKPETNDNLEKDKLNRDSRDFGNM